MVSTSRGLRLHQPDVAQHAGKGGHLHLKRLDTPCLGVEDDLPVHLARMPGMSYT